MQASVFCALAICKIGRVSSSPDYVKTQCGNKNISKTGQQNGSGGKQVQWPELDPRIHMENQLLQAAF